MVDMHLAADPTIVIPPPAVSFVSEEEPPADIVLNTSYGLHFASLCMLPQQQKWQRVVRTIGHHEARQVLWITNGLHKVDPPKGCIGSATT